jgi:hypothetical protein
MRPNLGERTARAMAGLVRSRPFLAVAALAVLFAAYWAAGTWLAPDFIRSQATAWARDELKKPLHLGEIKVDPLGFKLDISDIAIPDAATPMVAARQVHLNFSILSLFADAYRFDEVRIDGPAVHALIRPDGTLNLLELVPPPSPEPVPAVLIGELSVLGGRIAFADHSRAAKPAKLLAPISFSLRDFHTARSEGGGFRFEAESERGETFAWQGHVSMAPIASDGSFTVRHLEAASIQDFLGEMLPVALSDGLIDLHGSYDFRYKGGATTLSAMLPKLGLTSLAFDGKDLFRGRARLGEVDVDGASLALAIPENGAMAAEIIVPHFALRDATANGPAGAGIEPMRLAGLTISDIRVNAARRRIDIRDIRAEGLKGEATRAQNGTIDLSALLPPAPKPAVSDETAPWQIALGGFSLSDAALRFEDRAVSPAAVFDISANATARGDLAAPDKPIAISADARINKTATLSAEGMLLPPGSADLRITLAGFPLKAALPYMPPYPALDLKGGDLGIRGRLIVSDAGTAPKARFSGDAVIAGLRLFERAGRSELISWRRLALSGIDYRGPASPRVEIAHARLSRPTGRVAILRDGTFNFAAAAGVAAAPPVPAKSAQRLTRAERRAETKRIEAARAAKAIAAQAALAAPQAAPAIPVFVKRLDIDSGTMSFADYSIQPNFEARIEALRGRVTGISNMPGAVAEIDLDGHVINRFSPVKITGRANLLAYDRKTDVKMAFRNIELPVFNPYSGRYAGYAIARGKLTTELGYRIDNRALEADHHVIIDQLEWGEATDSKEKVPMPIRLATSLLKDKNGVIDLEVPITGSLDDPQFRLGPIIWKIIGNILEKIVTAPFRFIGSLFAGAEEAQFVDFVPGSAALPESATKNLSALAKGLADRPALKLDIPASPGIEADAIAIADQRMAEAAMAREIKKGESPDLAALTPDKRHDRLKDLYKAKLGSSPDFPETSDTVSAADNTAAEKDGISERDARRNREAALMADTLRPKFLPTDAELAALGRTRAEAVRDALLADGAIDPARVFLSTRQAAKAKDSAVRMELSLE